jgi:hypothetical protein
MFISTALWLFILASSTGHSDAADLIHLVQIQVRELNV